MINFRFILNPDSDNIETEEPIGFDDAAIEIVRDPKYHGISIAYGTSDLEFIGEAAGFLKEQNDLYGIDAEVELQIIAECDGVDAWDETFRLDFGQYSEGCGDKCSVKIGIEQISCFQKFSAGLDKKVDIEATATFGGDAIPILPNLKKTIELPSKTILKTIEAYVIEGADPIEISGNPNIDFPYPVPHHIRPIFADVRYENIKTSQVSDPSVVASITTFDSIVSPYLLYEDNPKCFSGGFDVSMRLKGSIHFSGGGKVATLIILFIKIKGSYLSYQPSDVLAQQVIIGNDALPPQSVGSGLSYNFDVSYSNPSLVLEEGDNIFGLVTVNWMETQEPTTSVSFAPETFVKIEGLSNCPPTNASLFMPFEVIQRAADIITDNCLKLDSRYYGRTDTPTVYPADGCGAFRSLTAGLFIRNAPKAKLFATLKEIIDGLQPIDAIGFGLQRDGQGNEILKVEPVDHFYQDNEILIIDGVNKVDRKTIINEIPGTIKVGYEKWQPESINGLDEFNSTREYRTTTRNATQSVDLVSKIIVGGYIIEQARQLNFAASGAQDTKYDNDLFLIQLKREAENSLVVEQGVPAQATNIFDPATVYNFRVSPVRNLLRWWNYLNGNAFKIVENGAFMFSSGTGNYLAAGFIPDECSPEAGILAESNDLTKDALKFPEVISRAESSTFEAPLSLDDFTRIRANPYGFISYECAGVWHKAYIQKITYRMSKGKASFELRSKYE